MTAILSSLDLGQEVTATGGGGRADPERRGMASVPPAIPSLTRTQDADDEEPGPVGISDGMTATLVRHLLAR
jgi:hypothetical protein